LATRTATDAVGEFVLVEGMVAPIDPAVDQPAEEAPDREGREKGEPDLGDMADHRWGSGACRSRRLRPIGERSHRPKKTPAKRAVTRNGQYWDRMKSN
jgi:hypothetical protein